MYTFTMVGCTLFKLCHCKCAKAYLLEILGMSRLWHDLMAHGHLQQCGLYNFFLGGQNVAGGMSIWGEGEGSFF